MERFVCIHGHFYQPPRENPWLEAVELQESAYPFHDWNERITEECYGPNARARILDGEGWVASILNTYSRMSFNFGPTLLSWLQENEPRVYASILEADRLSRERFGGHGSAMAQGYGHLILPLANVRDRRTQVIWGVRDFEHRFGRRPEGMWLAETAVNIDTLEALAEQGIRFTVLAPRQAARVRKPGGEWEDAPDASVDPSRAYQQRLSSGKTIALFFYDGPISSAVAFERLLESGERFSQRLLEAFDPQRAWAQLAHIATDGETYGHHHRHGEMALAHTLDLIERGDAARLTNYGEFLEKFPPTHEVQIAEDTAWSCAHGVERWNSDCGCCTGGNNGWNQAWRRPLREALDWLRDALIPQYEQAAAALLKDPWAARDDYISVVLDRSPESIAAFFARSAARELSPEETTRALKLLELQRHAMLMYTSCGWFFDELSGIETVQVIQYAGRVVQLAQELFDSGVENEFLSRLERAQSNIPEHGDGRRIYEKFVRPAIVDLPKVAAHFAISSLFEETQERERVFAFDAERQDHRVASAGRARLALGRARLTSRITRESAVLSYGVLHMGDHTLNAGVRAFESEEAFAAAAAGIQEAFNRADFPGVIRLMDAGFGGSGYTLGSLFRDQQHRVMRRVLEPVLEQVDAAYRQIYNAHAPLMRFLGGARMPIPRRLQTAAGFVLNGELQTHLDPEEPTPARARQTLAEAAAQSVALDEVTIGHTMRRAAVRAAARLAAEPQGVEHIRALDALIALAGELPFGVDFSRTQGIVYETMREPLAQARARAEGGDEGARQWLEAFKSLAQRLRIRLP